MVYDSNFEGRDLGIGTLTAGAQSPSSSISSKPDARAGITHSGHMVHNPTQGVLGMLGPAAFFPLSAPYLAGVADSRGRCQRTAATEPGEELLSGRIGIMSIRLNEIGIHAQPSGSAFGGTDVVVAVLAESLAASDAVRSSTRPGHDNRRARGIPARTFEELPAESRPALARGRRFA